MRESGFEYLGADEDKSASFTDILKKEAPNVLAEVSDTLKAKYGDKKTDDKKPKPKVKPTVASSDSWFSEPALGPIPGGGVLALGLGLLGTIGYVLLKR